MLSFSDMQLYVVLSSEILDLKCFFSLFQLEMKPQGRLLMEARYYLEKSGEWLSPTSFTTYCTLCDAEYY